MTCHREIETALKASFRSKAVPLLLRSVRGDMVLGRMLSVFLCVNVMRVRQMRVMGGSFVIPF